MDHDVVLPSSAASFIERVLPTMQRYVQAIHKIKSPTIRLLLCAGFLALPGLLAPSQPEYAGRFYMAGVW